MFKDESGKTTLGVLIIKGCIYKVSLEKVVSYVTLFFLFHGRRRVNNNNYTSIALKSD